ncbi:ligand-gated sodium channel [Mactra antiquata]
MDNNNSKKTPKGRQATKATAKVAAATTPTEKTVKKISVKPLMPNPRLNSVHDKATLDLPVSPKDKMSKKCSIHDLLEQMHASTNDPESKAGAIAADRWKKRTAKEIYSDFCEQTSFSALTRIHKASHWYPVEVKVEVTAVPNLDFPSVTICNLNPLKRSMMSYPPFDNLSNYFHLDDKDMLYDDFIDDKRREWMEENSTEHAYDDDYMAQFLQSNSYNRWDALENDTEVAKQYYEEMDDSYLASFKYSSVAATMTDEELEKYGHRKKDLIMSCVWQGKACSPANFTYQRNNFYGNCYTMNTFDNGMPSMTTNYAGPLMGLVLELNIEQDEYIPALSPDAGVRVLIHERGTFPTPEDDGVSVAPGFKTSIGIAKTLLTRLPPPHADCGDSGVNVVDIYKRDFDTKFSKRTCIKSCIQQDLEDICNCMSSYFYVPKNISACSCEEECVGEVIGKILEDCNNRCPTPCSDVKYDLTLSMSQWPSEQYEDHLDKKLQKSTSHFMHDDNRADSSSTLAKIEVFYKELMFEHVEQQKAYESQNLISDIGGQLGLWLGLSAITLGEVIEFLASLSRLIAHNMFAKKERKMLSAEEKC